MCGGVHTYERFMCISGVALIVPRPSHHPLFDRLQYAKKKKNGGGRPGPFYHVNDINVYLSRQRKGSKPKNELEAFACSIPSSEVLDIHGLL